MIHAADQLIIRSSIAAATGRAPWSDFLSSLASRFACRFAIILLHNTVLDRNLVSAAFGHSPDAQRQYQNPEIRDEWAARAAAAGILGKRIARGSELISQRELRETEFWEKVLKVDAIIDTLAIPVSGGDGVSGYLSIHADVARGEFTDDDVAHAQVLKPHIEDAISLLASQVVEQTKMIAVQTGLRSTGTGAILVDERRSVLFMCPTAQQILSKNTVLAIERDELKFQSKKSREAWARCLKASPNLQHPIALFEPNEGSRLAIWAQIMDDVSLDIANITQSPRMVLLLLREVSFNSNYSLAAAADAWDFTETEKNIARKLMAGETPEAIANSSEISITTVRWHIRNIFSKAGVNRTTELLLYLQKLEFLDELNS